MQITGIGQDSHRFEETPSQNPCILAGLPFLDAPAFAANSDGDVILHALCNAISSVTTEPILGAKADFLCLKQGITDSSKYLEIALEDLKKNKLEIVHIALAIEGKRPKLLPHYQAIRENLARLVGIEPAQVGVMATTGEELTPFGKGLGVQCFCIATFQKIAP
jgi:2-C-methyl-D-erythritol 2,4-cyclodiphosphate synthase